MLPSRYFGISLALILLCFGGWYWMPQSADKLLIQEADALVLSGGSHEEAIEKYQKALKINPKEIEALQSLGNLYRSLGRVDEAIDYYQKVVALDSSHSLAWMGLGVTFSTKRDWPRAKECLERAKALDPEQLDLHYEIGLAAFSLGKYEEAKVQFSGALESNPDQPQDNLALGCIYMKLEQYAEAIRCFEIALQRSNDKATIYNNLGYALRLLDLSRWRESLFCFERAIELQPHHPSGYNNLGCLKRDMGLWQEALICYQKAIQLDPRDIEVCCNLGMTWLDLENFEAAENCLQRALKIQPDHQKALVTLGMIYQAEDKKEQSLAAYKRVHPQSNEYAIALAGLYPQYRQLCQWHEAKAIDAALDHSTRESLKANRCKETPFNNLFRCMDPALNQSVAQNWSSYFKSKLVHAPFLHAPEPKEKLTIGYLSCDFFDHATTHLMAGLFRLHDKEKFHIIAYSYGVGDEESSYRKKIESHCSRFVDISGLSDDQSAKRIVDDKVDILIDLKGFTRSARPGIAMYRPAPVQVAYLGFPGTSGTDCFDYVLTDRIVTPESEQPYYDEKFLYMSACYQVNDNQQPISRLSMSRSELGLPEKGFVFASFNDPYKLDDQVFDTWMNLLSQVPGSILWLYSDRTGETPLVRAELDRGARARGIDPERIILAGRMAKPHHLRRLQSVDLALDTRTYNGHTTTSDALWAGVPVVAIQGTHFASRVSSSLLSAVGLPELITQSLPQYESLAVRLATHPEELSALREKLKANLPSAPLFDTERFTRELEDHYRAIYERKLQQIRLETTQ